MSTTVGPTLIFQAVDLAGVLANGVLGGLLARRLGFDPVGFVVWPSSPGSAAESCATCSSSSRPSPSTIPPIWGSRSPGPRSPSSSTCAAH
jgi:hypothetical protein